MTKLETFYQTLMSLKKSIPVEELDEGGDRTNHCYLIKNINLMLEVGVKLKMAS